MSENKHRDRKSVGEFFRFKLNQDSLRKRGPKFRFILLLTLLGLLAGMFQGHRQGDTRTGAWVGALLLMVIGVLLDRALARLDLNRRMRKKEQNNLKFAELAAVTRRVQAEDCAKATLRVFERCQLDRNELRVLQHQYHFNDNQDPFAVETPKQILGDLYSKSSTFRSFPNGDDDQVRSVYWKDARRQEVFFNPIRVVSLYLTETQIVVCDVVVDSITGDLQEEILRISLANVVSIVFSGERRRKKVTFNDAKECDWAKDQGLTDEEIADLRRKIAAGQDDAEWVMEFMNSHLRITRTDAGTQSLPVRSLTYFGKRKSALDGETLTEDEIAMDRMVNELNRMVENSGKHSRSGRAATSDP